MRSSCDVVPVGRLRVITPIVTSRRPSRVITGARARSGAKVDLRFVALRNGADLKSHGVANARRLLPRAEISCRRDGQCTTDHRTRAARQGANAAVHVPRPAAGRNKNFGVKTNAGSRSALARCAVRTHRDRSRRSDDQRRVSGIGRCNTSTHAAPASVRRRRCGRMDGSWQLR